jgi:hypothetical protein
MLNTYIEPFCNSELLMTIGTSNRWSDTKKLLNAEVFEAFVVNVMFTEAQVRPPLPVDPLMSNFSELQAPIVLGRETLTRGTMGDVGAAITTVADAAAENPLQTLVATPEGQAARTKSP